MSGWLRIWIGGALIAATACGGTPEDPTANDDGGGSGATANSDGATSNPADVSDATSNPADVSDVTSHPADDATSNDVSDGDGSAAMDDGLTDASEVNGEPTDVPIIDHLVAVVDADGVLGIRFEGRPGPIAVRWGHLELLDEVGEVLGTGQFLTPLFSAPSRFSDVAVVAFIEQSSAAFSGSATYVDVSLGEPPARLRVTFENQEEQMGVASEVDVSKAEPRVVVGEGDECDPFGLWSACPESTLCDVRDPGIGELPTCQPRPTSCALEYPVLEVVYEGSNAESSDDTQSSCTLSRGNLGREQGHVFTAPDTGVYRFVVESVDSNAALTLFIRRYCEFASIWESELACSHETETDDARPNVEVQLVAGETVYVFVEAWWANGGEYRLSVEAP